MRRLLFLIVLLAPLNFAQAITGDDTRFDWSAGLPALTADNTNTCNDTAQARFDWVLGQPAIVHDATANCTAAGGGVESGPATLYLKNGDVRFKNSDLRVKR